MKLFGWRHFNLLNGRRRLWSGKGLAIFVIGTFIVLNALITTVYKRKNSEKRIWLFGTLFPLLQVLHCESLRCILNSIATCGGLFYSVLGSNCTFASLISFGIMFAFTSYLVLCSLKFKGLKKQRTERYRRVSSCLWTRRKVY